MRCSVCRNQCRCQGNIVLIGSQIWALSNSLEISLQTLSALQVVNCLFFPRRKVLKWTFVRRTGHWFPETLLALEWPWSYQAAQEISWAPPKSATWYNCLLTMQLQSIPFGKGSTLQIARTYGKNHIKWNHPFPPGPSSCWSNEWTSTALKWLLSISAQLIFHFVFERHTDISPRLLYPIISLSFWLKTANHKARLHHVTHHEHAHQGLSLYSHSFVLWSLSTFILRLYDWCLLSWCQ